MKHSEITYLAKEIVKVNSKLIEAIMAASELVNLDELMHIVEDRDSPAFRELCEKVAKYSYYESAINTNDPTLDIVQRLLDPVFAEAFK